MVIVRNENIFSFLFLGLHLFYLIIILLVVSLRGPRRRRIRVKEGKVEVYGRSGGPDRPKGTSVVHEVWTDYDEYDRGNGSSGREGGRLLSCEEEVLGHIGVEETYRQELITPIGWTPVISYSGVRTQGAKTLR